MEKRAIIEINNKKYTFEIDRKSIILMETKFNFQPKLFEKQPLTQSLKAWMGGLNKNHPELTAAQCEDLFDAAVLAELAPMEIVNFVIEQYTAFFQTTQLNSAKNIVFE